MCFAVLPKTVFAREVVEVIENLATSSIDGRPVQLWLERPGVIVSWYIASASNSVLLLTWSPAYREWFDLKEINGSLPRTAAD